MPRLEEIIQETESSGCPHLIRRKPGKYKDAQTECEHLKENVNQLKVEIYTLEEKLKAQEKCYKVELESLRQSHEETFRKFQRDTKNNLNEALPKWKSNLVLHTQVAVSPLDLSEVDFNCLRDISTKSLNFNVYHPEGEE
ncbi:hypothetical protein PVK06_024001 [Gossypium arboreum]|uniref:Uncharacterized protein n=1 Tax=Gossypium arboreum TaxID=29729 RepID=A0ABR0PCR3_GOSAR|nr:hypothetical protein PVK06_024001 [Gossypium arboreum]